MNISSLDISETAGSSWGAHADNTEERDVDSGNIIPTSGGRQGAGADDTLEPMEQPWKQMEVATSIQKEGNEDEDEDEEIELEQDAFTLFFLSGRHSIAFFYSIFAIGLQFTILSLILYDLMYDDSLYQDPDNWFKVPVHTETAVKIAQYIALLLAVVTQEDLIHAIYLINVGYNRSILETNVTSTYALWIVTCTIRFTEGSLSTVVAFVFVVQSGRVLDIFLNFVAVEFIMNLDNVAFQIGNLGLLGNAIQNATERVSHVKLSRRKKGHRQFQKLQQLVILACILGMWALLAVIQYRQNTGYYMNKLPSPNLQISFPEEFLEPSARLNLNDTKRNRALFRGDIYNEPANILVYPFFSGEYILQKGETIADRPVYYERGFDDVTSGMFYYCEQDQAWVFTIRAVNRSDLPESNCEHGWLMQSPRTQSPRTEAFTLEAAGAEGWKVWTGAVAYADLGITFNFCYRDSDCGGHGKCKSPGTDTCTCDESYGGKHCEFELPFCSILKGTKNGDNALSYAVISELELVEDKDSGTNSWLYDRPFYKWQNGLVFYSGTRWLHMTFQNVTHKEGLLDRAGGDDDDVDQFHAYWHLSIDENLIEYSHPTTGETPIDAEWNSCTLTASVGDSAPYGIAFPVKQSYVCKGDCTERKKANEYHCGYQGSCSNETGTDICLCTVAGVGGDYCEFLLDGDYVLPLTVQFYLDFDSNWKLLQDYDAYPELNYAIAYWKKLTYDELKQAITDTVHSAYGLAPAVATAPSATIGSSPISAPVTGAMAPSATESGPTVT